jgi:hypothetical protein
MFMMWSMQKKPRHAAGLLGVNPCYSGNMFRSHKIKLVPNTIKSPTSFMRGLLLMKRNFELVHNLLCLSMSCPQ